jgi:hypothetical protein
MVPPDVGPGHSPRSGGPRCALRLERSRPGSSRVCSTPLQRSRPIPAGSRRRSVSRPTWTTGVNEEAPHRSPGSAGGRGCRSTAASITTVSAGPPRAEAAKPAIDALDSPIAAVVDIAPNVRRLERDPDDPRGASSLHCSGVHRSQPRQGIVGPHRACRSDAVMIDRSGGPTVPTDHGRP